MPGRQRNRKTLDTFSDAGPLPVPEPCNSSSIYSEQAKQLRSSLRAAKQLVSNSQFCKWVEVFRLMSEVDHFPDIQKVLSWYCSHCDLEHRQQLQLPCVSSAKQFRSCFIWIKDVHDRCCADKEGHSSNSEASRKFYGGFNEHS